MSQQPNHSSKRPLPPQNSDDEKEEKTPLFAGNPRDVLRGGIVTRQVMATIRGHIAKIMACMKTLAMLYRVEKRSFDVYYAKKAKDLKACYRVDIDAPFNAAQFKNLLEFEC